MLQARCWIRGMVMVAKVNGLNGSAKWIIIGILIPVYLAITAVTVNTMSKQETRLAAAERAIAVYEYKFDVLEAQHAEILSLIKEMNAK